MRFALCAARCVLRAQLEPPGGGIPVTVCGELRSSSSAPRAPLLELRSSSRLAGESLSCCAWNYALCTSRLEPRAAEQLSKINRLRTVQRLFSQVFSPIPQQFRAFNSISHTWSPETGPNRLRRASGV